MIDFIFLNINFLNRTGGDNKTTNNRVVGGRVLDEGHGDFYDTRGHTHNGMHARVSASDRDRSIRRECILLQHKAA